ncbi:mate-domain-containing protein, partial [Jimgerdemannia flammicorona]
FFGRNQFILISPFLIRTLPSTKSGTSLAVSTRVGNLLGAQLPEHARIASNVGILFAIVFGLFNSIILLVFKDVWGYLFTSDPAVVVLVAAILPLCALFQVADGLAGIGGGVLRGMGRQTIGAALNLVAYYGCALPLGTWLTFQMDWGLKGLWTGLFVALFVIGAGETVFICTTDWDKEIKRCMDRVRCDGDFSDSDTVTDVV